MAEGDKNKTPRIKRFEETEAAQRLHIHVVRNTIPTVVKIINALGGIDLVNSDKGKFGLVVASTKIRYLENFGKPAKPGDTTPEIPPHLLPQVPDIEAGCIMYIRRREVQMSGDQAVVDVAQSIMFLIELTSDEAKLAYKANVPLVKDLLTRIVNSSKNENDPYSGIKL